MNVAERVSAIRADITTLAVDAVVNAANAELFPGGGVDGAIRRAAGREMDDALFRIGRCEPGTSLVTPGYRLAAKWAIHTVAPIYAAGTGQEPVFARCYESALEIADERDVATIAFPCIGTGIYGWPGDLAARLAFETVVAHLNACAKQTTVTFCCFSDADRERYAALIAGLR
jgi:O-acetyl-ADP-ribose deacetylase (regulator of RNase III)